MPPAVKSGVMSCGRKAESSRAADTKTGLLEKEPFAIDQTIGNSRSADTSVTRLALDAKSSPTTPAVFFAAALVIRATSSKTAVMSSGRVNSEANAIKES